jgi:hypothetical protein
MTLHQTSQSKLGHTGDSSLKLSLTGEFELMVLSRHVRLSPPPASSGLQWFDADCQRLL